MGLWILRSPLQQLFGSYQSGYAVSGLGISGSFLVLVVAGFLGWLGAALSVLRHLRAIEPR
jgi:cell division transport system permease protein